MELPANPNALCLTAYDEYGRAYDEIEKNKNEDPWQLSDDQDLYDQEYDQTPLFGSEGGYY